MSTNTSREAADPQLEFLTFTLGGESYAVDILKVREVRAWEKLRVLHDVPAFVTGVLNLRGRIVPVIDLRIRFALPEAGYDPTTVIIVISLADANSRAVFASDAPRAMALSISVRSRFPRTLTA